ncbi:MAG: EamA family transporter [Acidobacteriota bacterium]
MQILVFGLLCFVWGFSWVAIKLTLEGFPPFLGAGLRFLLAVPLLAGYAVWRGVPIRLPFSVVKIVFVTAVLTYAFDYGLIYWAEQHLSAGVTAILFATFPIFTGLFSRWLLPGERLGFGVFVGLLLGFLGVFVTYSDGLRVAASGEALTAATAAVVVGAAGGALATVLIKRDLGGLHPVSLTLWQMIFGSSGLIAFAVLVDDPPGAVPGWPALFGLLYLGVVASALAFTLYYWLLAHSRAVSVSTMIFVTPVVALIGDSIVFGGDITPRIVAGMLLVFGGIGVTEFPRYRGHFRRLRSRSNEKMQGSKSIWRGRNGGASQR